MIFALLIGFSVSTASAASKLPDDDLGHALQNLKGKVVIVDNSFLNALSGAGWKALSIGISAAGVLALAKRVHMGTMSPVGALPVDATLMLKAPEILLLQAAGLTAAVGSFVGMVGTVGKRVRGTPAPQPAAYYQSKDGMNEFFRLKLKHQYAIASQDPELEQYILNLSASFDMINNGIPTRATAPDSAPANENQAAPEALAPEAVPAA